MVEGAKTPTRSLSSFEPAKTRLANRKRMVVALVFTTPSECDESNKVTPLNEPPSVLLVKKKKPDWQIGKWNGPGGEVEPGEDAAKAASRELFEETGLHIEPEAWEVVGNLAGSDFDVTFLKFQYAAGYFAPILTPLTEADAESFGTEYFRWYSVDSLPAAVVYDLRWVIPFALDGRIRPTTFELKPSAEVTPTPCVGGKETDRRTRPGQSDFRHVPPRDTDLTVTSEIPFEPTTVHSVPGEPLIDLARTLAPAESLPAGAAVSYAGARAVELTSAIEESRASGEVMASFPPFVPPCPPVVPEPIEQAPAPHEPPACPPDPPAACITDSGSSDSGGSCDTSSSCGGE